jgi:hypothetical protein
MATALPWCSLPVTLTTWNWFKTSSGLASPWRVPFYRGESLASRLEVAFDYFVELEELQAIAPDSIRELKTLEVKARAKE